MPFSGLEVAVEVTVKEGDTSKQRGDLLEAVAKRVVSALQYDHVKTEVRVTGCEIDVLGSERQTQARLLVECKAYRDRKVPAETLSKLVGNRYLQGYDVAWLITTSPLAKDAIGVVNQLRSDPQKAKELKVFEPEQLVDLLVDTGQVVAPDRLDLPTGVTLSRLRTLMFTDIGEYWVVSALGQQSGVADTALAFDAVTGVRVANSALVQQLAERDSNLRDLTWIAGDDQTAAIGAFNDAALKLELDNIAPVPMADDWSDYRPARPQDFVGRNGLLVDIIDFFGEVRRGNTDTRLLAVKAPSGWGKSSFLVKLRSSCGLTKNRDHVFLYAVDCRTASSPRYPELALKKCFDEAISQGFLSSAAPVRIGSPGQPFADPSVSALLEQLRSEEKVLVLFFDQFEEITTKQDLADLFSQVKKLCSAIESARENVVLGFSWKTDGSIPTDHPAYHVWHSFADRRREYELPLFSKQDTSRLLSGLSRELTRSIEPWFRRLLAEHSQGYPWLLKKLCVHVFQVLQTQPARQRELFERALDVEALFKKDLSDLDPTQIACLERVARESPADGFKILEQFGDKTVEALMQRRLVVRNAGKLIVYWDIFRDYILTKKVPAIPMRYIPVSSPSSAKRVLEVLTSGSVQVSTEKIGRDLGLQGGTLDNIARDLVMMGVVQYDRKKGKARRVHQKESQAVASMFRFFSNHYFLRVIIDQFGPGFRSVSQDSIESALLPFFEPGGFERNTIHVSVLRLISWFQAFGIVNHDADGNVNHDPRAIPALAFDHLRIESRSNRGGNVFKGEASPQKVVDLLRSLASPSYKVKAEDRNSLYVLRSLRLITSTKQPVLLETPPPEVIELWLAVRVSGQPSVKAAIKLISEHPHASPLDVGSVLGDFGHENLSEGSKRRYGNGLIAWIAWMRSQLRTPPIPAPPRPIVAV